MRAYLMKPPPGGGFHLGREGLGLEATAESFPSDSLFAALVLTYIETGGAVEDFIGQWPRDEQPVAPPFRLSSLFPFAGKVLLLPMPRLRVKIDDGKRHVAKRLKKLAYVSPGILQRLLSGEAMDDWLPGEQSSAKGVLLQDGKVWISREEVKLLPNKWAKHPDTLEGVSIWKTGTVPRVALDRVSSRSQIYQVGRTAYAEDCGLWLLVDGDCGELETLLYHLADEGIGGRRSSGLGAFKLVEGEAPNLPSAKNAPRAMTLSRYSPTQAELDANVLGENAAYELVDVGGWLWTAGGPSQRRRRVRMIEAGAVLEAHGPITGQIVDVRPVYENNHPFPHPVYRGGVALTIGVNAPVKEG